MSVWGTKSIAAASPSYFPLGTPLHKAAVLRGAKHRLHLFPASPWSTDAQSRGGQAGPGGRSILLAWAAMLLLSNVQAQPAALLGKATQAAPRSPRLKWQLTNGSDRSQTIPLCSPVVSSWTHLPVPAWCKAIPPLLNDSRSLQSTILFYSRCQTGTFHVNFLQPTPLSAPLLFDIYSPVKCAFICWHFY